MNIAGLMDNPIFLFFCYMMDEGDFSPLQLLLIFVNMNERIFCNAEFCLQKL